MSKSRWISIRSLCSGTTPLEFIAIAFLALALSQCGGGSGTPAFDTGTKQLMQSSIDTSVSAIGVPGATMTIIRPDGAKWVGVSGRSNIENNTAMAPGLKFRIASVTKTFTATVILQLVQEGRLSLDDKLESVLPGLIPNGAQINLRQLLNHTSGLFDYTQAQNPDFLAGQFNDPLRKWLPEELVAVANTNPPYFAPGGGYHYSNTNYVLLGKIIEKVTGNTYAQEIRSRILVPLGLNNTSLPDAPDRPGGSTQGYTYDGAGWVNTTRVDPSFLFATGNLISDSEDLVVWLNVLMNGTLLDQQRKADMFTFVTAGTESPLGYPVNVKYGLGLEKHGETVGHTGDFVFGGQAAVYQNKGWTFIVLVNGSPSKGNQAFGSEYIMFEAMNALGLTL